MPTYVYRREDGSTFEIDQRITADALTTCPETGQKVKRIITGSAGLIFKGSGFYLTDYVRGNGGSEKREAQGNGESGESAVKDSEKNGAAAGESSPSGEKAAASSEAGKGASGNASAKSEE